MKGFDPSHTAPVDLPPTDPLDLAQMGRMNLPQTDKQSPSITDQLDPSSTNLSSTLVPALLSPTSTHSNFSPTTNLTKTNSTPAPPPSSPAPPHPAASSSLPPQSSLLTGYFHPKNHRESILIPSISIITPSHSKFSIDKYLMS